jgi:hypothetical protein
MSSAVLMVTLVMLTRNDLPCTILRHLFVHKHKATHNTIFDVRQGNYGAFSVTRQHFYLHFGGSKPLLCTKKRVTQHSMASMSTSAIIGTLKHSCNVVRYGRTKAKL